MKAWRHKWHLFLVTTLKTWKAVFRTLQVFFLQKNKTYSENPISIGKNGVKLQAIKEIQISRHMTIHGQTLGVFKRKNTMNVFATEKRQSCMKSKLQFFEFGIWRVFRQKLRHYDVKWRNSWRNTHHRPHILNSKKLQFWFVFSPLRLRLLFSCLNTP